MQNAVIYAIRGREDQILWVGQTQWFLKRKKQHLRLLSEGQHCLQDVHPDDVQFEILEELPSRNWKLAHEREQHWANLLGFQQRAESFGAAIVDN